jgi:hypothetical protein
MKGSATAVVDEASTATVGEIMGQPANGGVSHDSPAAAAVAPAALLQQINDMERERDEERELDRELCALDREISEIESKIEGFKGEKKAKEERREGKVNELRSIIRGTREPLLPGMRGEKVATAPAAAKPVPAKPEAWRQVKLRDAFDKKSISDKVIEKLRDALVKNRNDAAGIETLGDLNDFQKKNRLTDIKGIGPEMEGKIGDAFAEYFVKHPEMQEQATAAVAAVTKGLPRRDTPYTLDEVGVADPEAIESCYAGDTMSSVSKKTKKKGVTEWGRGKVKKVVTIKDRDYVVVGTSSDGTGRKKAMLRPLYAIEEWGQRPHGNGRKFDHAEAGGLEVITPGGVAVTGPDAEEIDVLLQAGEPGPQKFLTPDDIGLAPQEVEAACHSTLLATAGHQDSAVADLHGIVNFQKHDYVIVPDRAENIFALRTLLPKTGREPRTEDPLFGRQVRFNAEVFEIGPKEEMLLVKIADATETETKPSFDPAANRDPKPDDVVPLKEAMGSKKKVGKNRKPATKKGGRRA